MHFTTKVAAVAAFAGLASAAPLAERQSINDGQILNYALTLEHLEATFYAEALNMFSAQDFKDAGYEDWARYRLTEVANEEATHVTALTAALKAAGVTPVAACKYNFGFTDVNSFLYTAATIEGVGSSAYLGAAASISNKDYLTVAGAILAVEVEHTTWERSAIWNLDPFPRAFFPYLSFDQVYTIAAPFIVSCPSSNPTLPVKAFPALNITTAGPYSVGEKITISIPSGLGSTLYAAFIDATATTFQKIDGTAKTAQVTIPSYSTGQSYLVLTNTNSSFGDAATVAGPAILEVPVQATTFSYCTPGSTC